MRDKRKEARLRKKNNNRENENLKDMQVDRNGRGKDRKIFKTRWDRMNLTATL